MEWKEDTKDFDRLLKNINLLAEREIKVGFFDTRYGEDNNNLYVAQVAQWQEEGVAKNNIPSRPFFRQGFHNGVMKDFKAPLGKLIDSVAKGLVKPFAACKKLGEGLKVELESSIENGDDYAPNQSKWAAHKKLFYGITTPLTYTGFMKESVKFKITKVGKDE